MFHKNLIGSHQDENLDENQTRKTQDKAEDADGVGNDSKELQSHPEAENNEAPGREADTKQKEHEDRSRRVYVGNLSWSVNWQTLKDFLKSHDLDVTRVDIMMTPEGRSKGCAIVEFATSDDARKAVLALNDNELEGRQIFVREDREDRAGGPGGSFNSSHAFSSDQNAKSRRVYVGNLAWDVAWQDLKDFCKQGTTLIVIDESLNA